MKLRAEVYTRRQLGLALEISDLELIYAPYTIIDASLSKYSDRIAAVPPLFLADCEEKLIKAFSELKKSGFAKALVHTVGHIGLFSEIGMEMYGGHRLNCVNSDSLSYFNEKGVKDIIVSPELTAFQINGLEKPCEIGFLGYGYLPLMVTRRCPVKNGRPCNTKNCGRTIKDRMNNQLNVICCENAAEILNSDVLYLADKLERFENADFTVLKFTVEDDIKSVIKAYKNEKSPEISKFTRGLYFRGLKNQ